MRLTASGQALFEQAALKEPEFMRRTDGGFDKHWLGAAVAMLRAIEAALAVKAGEAP